MTMDKCEGVVIRDIQKCSRNGDFYRQQGSSEKALDAYRNAFKNAKSLITWGYMQRACAFNLGAILVELHKYEEGLTYLSQALPPENQKDGKSNGDLFFNQGLAHEGLKNISDALTFFEKALKEYRMEDNKTMEADTLLRLVHLNMECNKTDPANIWINDLVTVYEEMPDEEKLSKLLVNKATLLMKMNNKAGAKDQMDKLCARFDSNTLSPKHAKILIDTSMVLTQLEEYNMAIAVYEKALKVVKDSTYEATIYQNLGVIYSIKKEHENALTYHQKACAKFANLNNRQSQGRCFTNMGYSYSQMKDMDKAGECYILALQTAKELGDKKSQWQNHESLGAVAFNQRSLAKAEEHYRNALTALAQSLESGDSEIEKRIFAKLKSLLSLQQPQNTVYAIVDENQLKSSKLQTTEASTDANDTVLRRGSKIKYLKVRRSGTLQKFQKVALGLDTGDRESTFVTDTEESEDTEDVKRQQKRPPDSYIGKLEPPHHASDDDSEDGDEEMIENSDLEENSKMEKEYRRHMENEDEEEESDDESEEDEDKPDSNEKRKRRIQKPTLPIHSPPSTSKEMGTYEEPAKDLHYETIDHKPPVDPNNDRRSSGVNFFDSSDANERTDTNNSTVYETVQPQARVVTVIDKAKVRYDSDDSNETEDDPDTIESLSRAERDVYLYANFKKNKDREKEDEEEDDDENDDEVQPQEQRDEHVSHGHEQEDADGDKKSRLCIVM